MTHPDAVFQAREEYKRAQHCCYVLLQYPDAPRGMVALWLARLQRLRWALVALETARTSGGRT